MAGVSKIEWCDATFNPWWGCERVSPACAHCYADTFSIRLGMKLWGDGHDFRFFGDKHWDEPLKWARTLPAKLGRRPRLFCASMADVFEERDELDEHRRRLFDLIEATPELDWLLLTKRPEFAYDWVGSWYMSGAPLSNIWMGVSIENARFTWRADVLREIPAAVRFISAEPLLGSLYDGRRDVPAPGGRTALELETEHSPLEQFDARHVGMVRDRKDPRERVRVRHDLVRLGDPGRLESAPEVRGRDVPAREDTPRRHPRDVGRAPLDLTDIDWVIIGGESGPGARPFHVEHAREIIRRCLECCEGCTTDHDALGLDRIPACTGRPAVFVKQLGAKPITRSFIEGNPIPMDALRDRKGGDMNEWPADLKIREFPRSAVRA